MSLEIAILVVILVAMVVLFLTEKLPVELTAFSGLVVLVFAGYVEPNQAFAGFSSPAVITMFSIFFISGALSRTGVADFVGRHLSRLSGGREVLLVLLLMLMAGALSAFMNNVAAAAVLLPAVSSVARLTGLSPARLFMPLAFGAILGGATTLVGTPPNILTGEMMAAQGLEPFALFDFAPVGTILLCVGMLFMITVGRWLLPQRPGRHQAEVSSHLIRAYRIDERLTTIRVPEGSVLVDATLQGTRLGRALDVSVVGVRREGKNHLAPGPDFRLEADDLLVVDAEYSDLEALLSMQGVAVSQAESGHLREVVSQVHGLVLELPRGSGLIGRTLQQLHFRQRFEALVVGIRRGRDLVRQELGRQVLRETDQLLVLVGEGQLSNLEEQNGVLIVEELPLSRLMEAHLFVIEVPTESPLAGTTVLDTRMGELAGLTIVGIVREGKARLVVPAEETIRAGDELLVAGEPDRLLDVLQLGPLDLGRMDRGPTFESDSIRVVEAVVAPRAKSVGSSLRQLHFRDRYGLQALALWRSGEAVHRELAELRLEVGDVLLLHGERDRIDELTEDDDFLVLGHEARAIRRHHKAPVALTALAIMIAIVVSGKFPIHVAAFAGAVFTVLFGALTMEEAYRAVEWRALFLVAAILPVGTAMETTGTATLLANAVFGVGESLGPHAFLAILVLLASFLSQVLDGAPTVVILAPVVVLAAENLQVSPLPLMMAVSLAASAAFMTPFSQKASLLVMSVGGYRTRDFLRVGTPLTLMVLLLIVGLVPLFFPF